MFPIRIRRDESVHIGKRNIRLYPDEGRGESALLPRTSRSSRGGFVCHVLNRGHGLSDVFHKDDFSAIVNLMRASREKVPVRLTGFCLVPNHFHLLLWPHHDRDVSRWMRWLMGSHVRRYHRHYQGSGHVWQDRFNALSVQSDGHDLTVLHYQERIPLRAKRVERSHDGEWFSLKPTTRSGPDGLLCDGQILESAQWARHVKGVETEAELKSLRHSLARGTPFGDTARPDENCTRTGAEILASTETQAKVPGLAGMSPVVNFNNPSLRRCTSDLNSPMLTDKERYCDVVHSAGCSSRGPKRYWCSRRT